MLARHGILSAPLVLSPDIEEVQDGGMSPQLLGWLDVADVLRAFLDHLRDHMQGQELPTKVNRSRTTAFASGPQLSSLNLQPDMSFGFSSGWAP